VEFHPQNVCSRPISKTRRRLHSVTRVEMASDAEQSQPDATHFRIMPLKILVTLWSGLLHAKKYKATGCVLRIRSVMSTFGKTVILIRPRIRRVSDVQNRLVKPVHIVHPLRTDSI